MIYCFGDSITRGRPGSTYIDYLPYAGGCKNHGLGGDTLSGMRVRMEKFLCRRDVKEDTVIVGIGTNDLLIPYLLKSDSLSWRASALSLIKRGSIPCEDPDVFLHEYRTMLQLAQSHFGKVLVFGLPMVECTENGLDEAFGPRNLGIQRICEENNIPFIDFRQWQKEKKRELRNNGSYFFASGRRNFLVVVSDAVRTTYLHRDESLSKKRGLAMTVDGVHPNGRSARGLAELIDFQIARP